MSEQKQEELERAGCGPVFEVTDLPEPPRDLNAKKLFAIMGPAVIALGGGTFVQTANVELVRESGGISIWLDCPVDELRRRCAGMSNRPLFRDAESFAQLLEQRLPYYQLADYRVSTESQSPKEIVESILHLNLF